MNTLIRPLALILSLLSIPAFAGSAPATRPAAQVKFTVDRIVVFKDGYALIAKTGSATADADGRIFTPRVPDQAVLGTFWALGDGQKLLGMRSEWDEDRQIKSKETSCITIPELLRANIGKRVTLGLPEKRTITGVLVEMLDLPPAPAPSVAAGAAPGFQVETEDAASPFDMLISARDALSSAAAVANRPMPDSLTIKRELTPRGGDFIVVDETETGKLILPVSQVQTIAGRDLVTKMTRQEELYTRGKRLSFDFGKASAGKAVSLKLFYFTSGMRWIPTYRVGGELKDKADLALQAELLNEVEDVDNAALDLVVGVPNFRFKDSPSPLTLERQLRSTLMAAAPQVFRNNDFNNFMSNSIQTQRSGTFRGPEVEGPAASPSLAPELSGTSGEQDLFLYSVPGFSLKRGARCTVPLWQSSVPMRHVYTYDVKMQRSRQGGLLDARRAAGGRDASPLRLNINTIWHQLELTNNSTVPWTTGAALTVRQNIPIGQDMLTYTPVGASALLPLTVAVDIQGTAEEEETGRKPNALRVDTIEYTLVRKKGTITIKNYRKEKAALRVSVSTGGKVEEATDEGKIKVNDFQAADWQESGYHSINNHSDVSWELTLDPGASKTLTYSVSFYVR